MIVKDFVFCLKPKPILGIEIDVDFFFFFLVFNLFIKLKRISLTLFRPLKYSQIKEKL